MARLQAEIAQLLEEFPLAPVLPTTVEEVRAEDKRAKCDCPMPFVHRKWHRALGTLVELRLCCLATKVEELLGLPQGSIYAVFEFEPTWEWDCAKLQPDQGVLKPLGPPPKWLGQRMQRKGIPIKNLEAA